MLWQHLFLPVYTNKDLNLKWKREQTAREQTAREITASDGEHQLQVYRETLTFPCLSASFSSRSVFLICALITKHKFVLIDNAY